MGPWDGFSLDQWRKSGSRPRGPGVRQCVIRAGQGRMSFGEGAGPQRVRLPGATEFVPYFRGQGNTGARSGPGRKGRKAKHDLNNRTGSPIVAAGQEKAVRQGGRASGARIFRAPFVPCPAVFLCGIFLTFRFGDRRALQGGRGLVFSFRPGKPCEMLKTFRPRQ